MFTSSTDSEMWNNRATWSLGWSEIGLVQLYVLSTIFQKTHQHNYNIRYSVYLTNVVVPKRKQNVVKCGVLNEEMLVVVVQILSTYFEAQSCNLRHITIE